MKERFQLARDEWKREGERCGNENGEHSCLLVSGHTSLWHACCISDIAMTTWTDSPEEWDRFNRGAYRKE